MLKREIGPKPALAMRLSQPLSNDKGAVCYFLGIYLL